MNGNIHILYACDSGYLNYSLVSACSILFWANIKTKITIHLFGLNLSPSEILIWSKTLRSVSSSVDIRIYEVSDTSLRNLPTWRGGWGACLRFLAPELIDEEWVLYLDGDTLILNDLSELWDLRDDNTPILGHLNPSARASEPGYGLCEASQLRKNYLNSGVLLINLRVMRELNFSQQWKDIRDKMSMPPQYPDQTLLNLFYLLAERTRGLLPNTWGVYSREGNLIEMLQPYPSLIHYASDAPWIQKKREIRDVDICWYRFVDAIPALTALHLFPKRTRIARFRFWCLSRIPTFFWKMLLRILKKNVSEGYLDVHRGKLDLSLYVKRLRTQKLLKKV